MSEFDTSELDIECQVVATADHHVHAPAGAYRPPHGGYTPGGRGAAPLSQERITALIAKHGTFIAERTADDRVVHRLACLEPEALVRAVIAETVVALMASGGAT